MKTSSYFLLIFTAMFYIACGPSDEEKASTRLKQVQSLIGKEDTLTVIKRLDSIAIMFPKANYAVNASQNLKKEIQFDLLHRKESQLDSLRIRISELENPFRKEKTEFDRYTQYIHKRQTFERAWNRSYIQVHLDERGEIYLSSNYHGKDWLNHTAIRVYDQGDDAKTEEVPIDNVDNHRSDFMDAKWEKVSYRNGKATAVMEFIAANQSRNLKAVFLGKEYYYIILESYDKDAVAEALILSEALTHKRQLENEIAALKKQLRVT